LSEKFILKKKRRVYVVVIIKLRSYWTNVYQINTQCSQIIADELFNNQNGDIAIRFVMPGLRIKVNSPILPVLNVKLVAMATSFERLEKWGQIGNLRSNTYDMVKIW